MTWCGVWWVCVHIHLVGGEFFRAAWEHLTELLFCFCLSEKVEVEAAFSLPQLNFTCLHNVIFAMS
ncbi:hypothetical protein DsansV1_C26g0190401 [Dioscorea sansibarensis]